MSSRLREMSKKTNVATLLAEYKEEPYLFIENNDIEELIQLARYASDEFFNGVSVMEDAEYDLLIDAIREKNPLHPFLKEVGAPSLTKEKIKLPFSMASMNKIKPDSIQDMIKWKKNFKPPYLVSDKLDGVSVMLEMDKVNGNKMYTRGNGTIGTDITPIIKYLNLKKIISKIKGNYVVVRGELIMSKNNFKKYETEMANARNMVSGIVNSKKINKERIADVDFVPYEIIEPWMSIEDQYIALDKNGFHVVSYEKIQDFNVEILQEILRRRKQLSEYNIDGIIVSYNTPKKRINTGNPDYAFAFKETMEDQTAEVEVLEVEWNESKDGYLKPRLKLVPTKLTGVIIKHVTAFNGKFIKDNKIGKGTIIKLVRSGEVIPHILEVIKGTEADMPDGDYIWNPSGVDVMREEKTIKGHIKQLAFFFSTLGIKHVSDATTKKLVESGIDDIIKIVNIKKSQLKNIEGFKDKMIDKVYESITERIKTMTMLEFMNATNIFGHGIGEKKLKKILNVYPNIITKTNVMELVMKLDGFDTITATQFADKLPEFVTLFNKLPKSIQNNLKHSTIKKEINEEDILAGIKIVFSGFRNKDWEKTIEERGGEIVSTVSKNTTVLVTKQEDIDKGTNSKIKKAIELGVEVMTPEAFEEKYDL